ncbi:MAG: hypothetical protein RL154_964 [Pseudomonadota bacterium]|jgi:exodeoxyribonuclease VII small subunit
MSKKTQEIKTFEEHLAGAKTILEKLSSPDVTLSESVTLYKNGLESIEEAQKLLDEAKLIIEEAQK